MYLRAILSASSLHLNVVLQKLSADVLPDDNNSTTSDRLCIQHISTCHDGRKNKA
jgi:hypothetical protein